VDHTAVLPGAARTFYSPDVATDRTPGEAQDGVVFVDRDGRHVVLRIATLSEIIALRHTELRPGLPEETAAFDGDLDATTRHFGGFLREDSPGASPIPDAATGTIDAAPGATAIACASFMARAHGGEPAHQLRGMATRAAMVGRGLGGALLRHAIAELVQRGGTRLFWCNARVTAVQFYRRMEWRIVSHVFDVPMVGPHRVMVYRASSEAAGSAHSSSGSIHS
jgi:GNAT superfamily N-acetyltransferase